MAGPTQVYEQLTILLTLGLASHLFIKRFHQPAIVGEILIGILLAPSLLGRFGIFLFDQTFIQTFAALGAIFLLFLIGLESDFRAVFTRKNFFVALGGVLLALTLGFVVAWLVAPSSTIGTSGDRFTMAIFVGATLTATSAAITASVLLDLGLIRDEIGRTILGAAVVDDIIGLFVLSVVAGMVRGSVDPVGVAILMSKAVVFVVVGILVGVRVLSPAVVRIQVGGLKLGIKHGGFIISMAIAFFYSFVAETIGLSAIIGAFLAGTAFGAAPLKGDFTEGARYLEAVFTPIFFISIGLAVNVFAVWATPELFVFGIALLVVAIVTKVAGCAIPARAQKMSASESIAVGLGMTPRGEVGLIVALTALTAGIFAPGLYSAMVLVIILVSVVYAPLFRRALRAASRGRPREAEPPAARPG